MTWLLTWLLTWLNVSVATLNATLQFLVIYRFVTSGILQDGLYKFNNKFVATSVLSLKRKRDVNPTYLWH